MASNALPEAEHLILGSRDLGTSKLKSEIEVLGLGAVNMWCPGRWSFDWWAREKHVRWAHTERTGEMI